MRTKSHPSVIRYFSCPIFAFVLVCVSLFEAAADEPQKPGPDTSQDFVRRHLETLTPIQKLGGRIFYDSRMSNPGANLATACSTCHVPPFLSGGKQLFSDARDLSVIPANSRGGKLTTNRNTPTLQDVLHQELLNTDGSFASLDAFLRSKISSEHLGWESGHVANMENHLYGLFMFDQGEDRFADGSYVEQFKSGAGVDIEPLGMADIVTEALKALKEYVVMIESKNTSPFDAMAFLNTYHGGLSRDVDTPLAFSGRIFEQISNAKDEVFIKVPGLYPDEAYRGYKTFFRQKASDAAPVEGRLERIGNCVACHEPPLFTDFKFHNTGTAQSAYDATHGDGAFVKLDVGSAQYGRISEVDPALIDLGRYHIEPSEETAGAFKTPGLRNVTMTAPYNHDGKQATLEDVIRHKIAMSELAKAGKLRNADPAYLKMTITEEEIPELVAFLKSLEEVTVEEFRESIVKNVPER
jgi:cytochrome c peroxidase